MDHLSQFTDRLLATSDPVTAAVVVGTAALALVVVAVRPVWRVARHGVTIAHEGGHALVAVLVGRRLSGIRLHSDTSGLTVSRGKPRGLGMILTLLAGYPAPALLGVGGAWLLGQGRVALLLWLALALLAVMLLWIRNLYGLVAMLVAGGLVFVVTWYADPYVQAGFGYALVWFLLIGAIRPVAELQASRWRRGSPQSDADQLGRLTHLPGLLWVGVFGLINLAAVGYAVKLLLWPALVELVG